MTDTNFLPDISTPIKDADFIVEPLSFLVGKSFTNIRLLNSEELGLNAVFHMDKGGYIMFHKQHCCEVVEPVLTSGDFNDIINTPLQEAKKLIMRQNGDKYSSCFTAYLFRSNKGVVIINWQGSGAADHNVDVSFKFVAEIINLTAPTSVSMH